MVQKKRHVAKALTWRVVATTTTVSLAWCATGDWLLATEVGILDASIKMVFYYVHERAWYRNKFGVGK